MKRICLLLTAVLLISSVGFVASASADNGGGGISLYNHGAGH